MRRLLAVPGYVVRTALVVVLLTAVVFVALTRTMVGREGLRRSLEAAFSQQFAGTLTIDTLSGNLVGTLDAQGVTIRDAQGDTVLSARRLHARPTLRGLVTRDLELREITLAEPRLTLRRDSAGTWNVARLVRPRPLARRPGTTRWRFGAPVVRIDAGHVVVSSAAPAPAAIVSGHVADVLNASYDVVSGQATVEWRATRRTVLVERLKLRAPALGLDIEDLSGQYREQQRSPGGAVERTLSGVRVRSGRTRLDTRLLMTAEGPIDGAVSGILDFDALRALFPRLPLRSVADLDVEATGTPEHLTVERFRVTTAQTRLSARGHLALTRDSLEIDAEGLQGDVRGADLRALFPAIPAEAVRISGNGSRLDLSRLHLSVDRANPRRYAMATQGRVVLPSGTVEGRATLALGTAVRWDLDLKTDHLDLDRLVGRDLKDTRVRGHLVTAGRAPALDAALLRTADTRIALSLGPGSVYGRVLDSLVLDGTLRQQRLDARFALRQGPSRAQGRIAATPGDLEAPFAFQAALDHFDVGALLVSDTLRTRLTGQIKADVQGCTLNDAAGRIVAELTETTLIWRGRTRSFAPLDAALERDATGEGRLRVRSDLGEADLRGSLRVDALRTVAETYLPRLDARFRSALGHRRGQAAEAPMPAGSAPPALQLQAALTVRDARALDALGLALPVSDSVRLEADLRTGPSGLSVAFTAMADTLRLKGNRRLANVRLRGHVRDDGREAPALTFEAFTDTVIGVPRFGRPMRLAGDVQGSSGRLALRTLVPGATGDGAALRLAFLPDRLRLFVDSLGFGADAYRFSTRQGRIDVYADAAVVEGLVFEANAPGARQRLTLDGSVSGAHSDTMHLRAAGVDVGTILGGRPERAPLGGRLDGDVAVTALLGQPEATGEVTVTTLTFGRHVLGDMTVRSFFRPGEPDVTLVVRLDSSAKIPPGMLATANRLHATGSYRLAGGGQPANLDLDLDATRLDAFFFDYLFPDLVSGTTGRIQARARVHGDPQRPQFTGTFTLRDGRLRVPGYGLAYTVNGRGHVDDDGLYLDDIEAVDGTGGSARVEGAVQFNAYRYVSLELRAALADLRLLDVPTSNDLPFYGRLWASGDATLSGPVDAAVLSASNVVVSPRSEVSIPIRETFAATDPGFIVHADSSGHLPDLSGITQRTSVFRKPIAERSFLGGLTMDLAFTAPSGSRLNLVIDPLRGDVMKAQGAGALQLRLNEGEFRLFGALEVEGGEYLFTASDLFARQFRLDGGMLTWDGDPTDPLLEVNASYRTRASLSGLEVAEGLTSGTMPLVVRLELRDRLQSPSVTLALALDRAARADPSVQVQALETLLNTPEHRAEYATSVLLTNSFLLTTSLAASGQSGSMGGVGNQLAFTSLSELVSAQLNRYLSAVVPGLELRVGVEGERTDALDLTYGVALRLLDDRLIIRGEGVLASERASPSAQGLQGEFVVEVRLGPAVSVEVYYRREDHVLQQVTASTASTTGASLAYQTRFASWRQLWRRLLGRENRAVSTVAADSTRASNL